MRANFAVEIQCVLRFLEPSTVQQVRANHDPSATFSRFAVNGCDVVLVLSEPLVQVFTERSDQLQLWWVMVFKRILSNYKRQGETRA